LKLNPANNGAWCSRAAVYRRLGQGDEALGDYNKVLALVADHPPTLRAIGELHLALCALDKAIVACSKAVKSSELGTRYDDIADKADSLFRRGQAYQQLGK